MCCAVLCCASGREAAVHRWLARCLPRSPFTSPQPAGLPPPAQIKLKNLGLQAAQRIVNAAANASFGADPLAALQEVAQDFPRLARQLSQMKYGKSLRVAGGRRGRGRAAVGAAACAQHIPCFPPPLAPLAPPHPTSCPPPHGPRFSARSGGPAALHSSGRILPSAQRPAARRPRSLPAQPAGHAARGGAAPQAGGRQQGGLGRTAAGGRPRKQAGRPGLRLACLRMLIGCAGCWVAGAGAHLPPGPGSHLAYTPGLLEHTHTHTHTHTSARPPPPPPLTRCACTTR
jgi:hypothetical protein